ncbi:MAG TPA: hypothetical protein VG476_05415, partial [Acidimicrobiales bacterium]|nr:hypothetical protein [Acidimicrobiales bacterium]
GVSPSVSSTDVWISLIAFVVVYIALGVADGYLMISFGRKALQEEPDEETAKEPERSDVPAVVY